MARIRTIKPEFFDSPGTARASVEARLLFIAMWCWADDWGIGDANPNRLHSFAFPNDEIERRKFLGCVKEVADCYQVTFYEVGGRPYYSIPSWNDHQRTERKAKRRNPPPPSDISAGQSADVPVTSELPTLNLGSSGVGKGKGERGTKDSCPSTDVEGEFDTWWKRYPRKVAKGQAFKAYKAARKKVDADVLLFGIEVQADQLIARGSEFCPYPATWLNGERWADDATEHEENPWSHLPTIGQLRQERGW